MKFKGDLIPPKLTTAERDALPPLAGRIIYNTTTNKLENFNGTVWDEASSTPTALFPPAFLYNNVKVVQTLSDFPTPVGNEIILEDKTYLIDALKLDMTGYTLVFGTRSAIQGFNQNVSSLQWKISNTRI
jgi:hypothetical protein